MFVTMVEAAVETHREDDLRAAWDDTAGGALPAGLIESLLLREKDGVWRIVTVWDSEDAVAALRAAGKPPAMEMFESAGSKPSASMWSVERRTST
jgi:heme-degrading monooxygenase HmoA